MCYSIAGTQDDLFQTSMSLSMAKISQFGTTSAEYSLSNENVQKFIHQKHLHFDLVINEEFFHDVYLLFGYKFKAPTITIGEYDKITICLFIVVQIIYYSYLLSSINWLMFPYNFLFVCKIIDCQM